MMFKILFFYDNILIFFWVHMFHFLYVIGIVLSFQKSIMNSEFS
jgi:hypothetical protein